ncbi:DUF3108 domain-containing protein [Roseateles sp. NT4]|uniref:DUF3108 domain-containing protein n=1 Tax=Roseateles sp. NT4 TaxID=3453715 RepID=UPI003EEB3F42
MKSIATRWMTVATLVCAATAAQCETQVATQTLHVGDQIARLHLLTASERTYLRYNIDGNGKRSATDIWRRKVSFEGSGSDRVIRISQRWDSATPDEYRLLEEATFQAQNMKPIQIRRDVQRGGKSSSRTYRFLEGHVTGTATERSPALDVKLDEPMFDFVTDIELLQTLPWSPGYSVSIPFYEPGGDAPGRYRFEVVGEDRLAMPNGQTADAWVVASNYNVEDGPVKRFWFAKGTQIMIREEVTWKDGLSYIKTLQWDEPAPLKPRKTAGQS